MDIRRFLALIVIVMFLAGCVAASQVQRPTLPEDCIEAGTSLCYDVSAKAIMLVHGACGPDQEFRGVVQSEYCYDAKEWFMQKQTELLDDATHFKYKKEEQDGP